MGVTSSVVAGENGMGALANVEALDVVTGTWRIFPALKQKRNGPAMAAAVGNDLYVSGGRGDGQRECGNDAASSSAPWTGSASATSTTATSTTTTTAANGHADRVDR